MKGERRNLYAAETFAALPAHPPLSGEPGRLRGGPHLGGGDHHPDRTFSNPRGRALAIPGGGPSLTQLRADLQAGDYFCGIAFLGTLPEGDPAGLPQLLQEKGYAEAYPFLADLPQAQIVTHEGSQVYCLVPPRDQETSLTVQAYRSDAENGYQGEVGDTLYTDTQGQPVILIGNVSDVIPNLQVTLVGADGTELVYHPALGLCDNTIALPATPKVYDFSLYSTEEAPVETDFLGRWTADGAELSFAEDGTMTYTPPDGAAMTGTFMSSPPPASTRRAPCSLSSLPRATPQTFGGSSPSTWKAIP